MALTNSLSHVGIDIRRKIYKQLLNHWEASLRYSHRWRSNGASDCSMV